MKKTSPALLAFVAMLLMSCSQKKENLKTTEQMENKQQIKKWYKAFNTKNAALLESILDENWKDIPIDPNHPVGKKEVGGLLEHLTTVFPDFHCEIKDIMTDGNKVIVRSTLTGKQNTEFRGFPSKNKSMSIQAIDIHEFKNGKIINTWHSEDWMSGLGQLGHLP